METDELETRPTFVQRLCANPTDLDWQTFYHSYGPVILRFAGKWGLDAAAAQDILQETVVTLMSVLPAFEYRRESGRFRNYVCTIAVNRIRPHLRRLGRHESIDAPEFADGLSRLESIEDTSTSLPGEEIDRCWTYSLWETALQRLFDSPRYEESVKAIFRDYVIENQPPKVVAAKHNTTANNVYQIKKRILRDLAKEIRILIPESEESDENAEFE